MGWLGDFASLAIVACILCAALSSELDEPQTQSPAFEWDAYYEMALCIHTGEVLTTGLARQLRSHALSEGGEQVALALPHDGATAVACSAADGTRAAGYSDGSVWLAQAMKPAALAHFHDLGESVIEMEFSPDGRRLAWATDCGQVMVVEVSDEAGCRVVSTITGLDYVECLTFAPDGRTLLVSGRSGLFGLWDADTGTMTTRIERNSSMVSSAAFSPDGRRIYLADQFGRVACWDRRLARTVWEHNDRRIYLSLALSPDGRKIICGSLSRLVEVRDAATGTIERMVPAHRRGTRCLQFLPHGGQFVSAGYDGRIFVWDSETWAPLRSL